MRPAVFLDRDDTINRNNTLPPAAWEGVTRGDLLKPEHTHPFDDAPDSLARLRAAGFAIVAVTNQGGVARAHGSLRDVEAVNDALRAQLTPPGAGAQARHPIPRSLIDAVYCCPFHPKGTDPRFKTEHPWRKPAPGMILAAARELHLDLTKSWLIGDMPRDLEAAVNAGIPEAHTILVTTGKHTADDLAQDLRPRAAHTLAEATDRVLASLTDAPARTVNATRVTLRATDVPDPMTKSLTDPLADMRTRGTVLAAARALAERTGLTLLELEARPRELTATLAAGRIAAMGFAAELRRTTNTWHTQAFGLPLWTEPPPPNPDDHTA
ncbi:MAG: HAD-IIIA family hydrolase [Planctomycetota bacterium]